MLIGDALVVPRLGSLGGSGEPDRRTRLVYAAADMVPVLVAPLVVELERAGCSAPLARPGNVARSLRRTTGQLASLRAGGGQRGREDVKWFVVVALAVCVAGAIATWPKHSAPRARPVLLSVSEFTRDTLRIDHVQAYQPWDQFREDSTRTFMEPR